MHPAGDRSLAQLALVCQPRDFVARSQGDSWARHVVVPHVRCLVVFGGGENRWKSREKINGKMKVGKGVERAEREKRSRSPQQTIEKKWQRNDARNPRWWCLDEKCSPFSRGKCRVLPRSGWCAVLASPTHKCPKPSFHSVEK